MHWSNIQSEAVSTSIKEAEAPNRVLFAASIVTADLVGNVWDNNLIAGRTALGATKASRSQNDGLELSKTALAAFTRGMSLSAAAF